MSANESSDCPPEKRAKLDEHLGNRDQVVNKYLYETLFKQELGSDIVVVVLEKKWKLHKLIIQQCPYFASMFSGNWKESGENVINITIEDSNITSESMEIVFGSMYGGNVQFTSDNVVSILAIASLFQIQDLVEKCLKFIIADALDAKSAIAYYNAAETYALPNGVKSNVMHWLQLNLISSLQDQVDYSFLRDISPELMNDLLQHPDIIIESDEFNIYLMLRKWLYLKLRKSEINLKEFYNHPFWQKELLLTDEGALYESPFRTISIRCLLGQMPDVLCIEEDNVIPKHWVQSAYKEFWQCYLRIMSNEDTGPTGVTNDKFEQECSKHCWYLKTEQAQRSFCALSSNIFGLDFELILHASSIKITRRRRENKQCIHVPNTKRNIMLRILLVASDGENYTHIALKSELKEFSLSLNEEANVMDFTKDMKYPALMMVKFLAVNPL